MKILKGFYAEPIKDRSGCVYRSRSSGIVDQKLIFMPIGRVREGLSQKSIILLQINMIITLKTIVSPLSEFDEFLCSIYMCVCE